MTALRLVAVALVLVAIGCSSDGEAEVSTEGSTTTVAAPDETSTSQVDATTSTIDPSTTTSTSSTSTSTSQPAFETVPPSEDWEPPAPGESLLGELRDAIFAERWEGMLDDETILAAMRECYMPAIVERFGATSDPVLAAGAGSPEDAEFVQQLTFECLGLTDPASPTGMDIDRFAVWLSFEDEPMEAQRCVAENVATVLGPDGIAALMQATMAPLPEPMERRAFLLAAGEGCGFATLRPDFLE